MQGVAAEPPEEPAKTLALAEENLVWREVDGEVIVLDKRTWSYLAINGSGALLWKQIAAGSTRDALVERLREAFQIDELTAARDTDEFLETMRSNDMLRAPAT